MKAPSYKVLPMLTEVVAPASLTPGKAEAAAPPASEPQGTPQTAGAEGVWRALEPALSEAVRAQLRALEPQLVEQLSRALRPALEMALARELQAMRKERGDVGEG